MIKVINKYKKGKETIELPTLMCECGGTMREVGSAGCAHDQNWTYIFQCKKCKEVQCSDYKVTGGIDAESCGWKLIKEE